MVAALLLAVGLGLPLAAQEAPPDTSFQLRQPARSLLSRIQVEWLEWLAAVNGGDTATAAEATESLLAYADQLGMPRLPELSLGASVIAVRFAREGSYERSMLALETAERLDPGRPETAFAEAAVAADRGERMAALTSRARGLARSVRLPLLRVALINDLAVWAAAVAALSGLLFIALQMSTKGSLLYRDLASFASRLLPPPLTHAACVALLVWPLLLPAGLCWLVLYWSVLLWGYGGRLERLYLALVWVLLGGLPLLLAEQHRRVEVTFAPAMRSLENAAAGRLQGDLVNGLAVVRRALPASVPLDQFTADLHRRLGQLDLARALYRRVLDAEPENAAALIDLGVCYHEAGDFDRAIEAFDRAAAIDPGSVEAYFDLSQGYSELYRFEESERALRRAREIDSDSVNRWMRAEFAQRVVAVDGGLQRIDQIRRELAVAWRRDDVGSPGALGWRQALTLPLALAFVLVAVGLHMATRGSGNRPIRLEDRWFSGRTDFWRRVLLPGVPEAEEGRWTIAVLAYLPFVALLVLPFIGPAGYRIPWGFEPGSTWKAWLVALGLAILLLRRLVRELAERR